MTPHPVPRQDERQIVFTNKARCRDCYRCLRVCPVKAIRMHEGQAYVDDARCLACGTCVRECPQGAKQYRGDLGYAMKLLEEGPVAVSMAPSFAGVFPQPEKMPTALRALGFDFVAETAVGAYHVAEETRTWLADHPDAPHICSACPAAVNFIESYRPGVRERIIPFVSPMVAHGRHLRRHLGEGWRIVFIGPCVAKKREAEDPAFADAVDCVLTFEELLDWFQRRGVDWDTLEAGAWDEWPGGVARLFPLAGGAAHTSKMRSDLFNREVLLATGFHEMEEALDEADAGCPCFIEPLFCPQGCVGGPGCGREGSILQRRQRVIQYAETSRKPDDTPVTQTHNPADVHLHAPRHTPLAIPSPDEEAIRRELELSGKADPADQLNCGACGYESCRDKAIAVLQGMAERDMCIPLMRRLAEKRSDRILEASPNGILLVDGQLNICQMNPAFRRMFACTDATYGKPVSYLMDPEPFEKVAAGESAMVERVAEHRNYGLLCHEMVYPLPEERRIAAIFVNVTNQRRDRDQLDTLRREAGLQARRLLELQGEMSREIARFLGESNARGEALVDRLLALGEDPEEKA